jgi:hypothetical protein
MKDAQNVLLIVAVSALFPAAAAGAGGVKNGLDLTSVDSEAFIKARQLNTKGYRLFKRGKFAGAIALWEKALLFDPAHLLARYNLACGYARLGQRKRALAELQQLRRSNCISCLNLLLKARGDRDLAGLRGEAVFKKLTEDLIVKEPNYRKLASKALRALSKENYSPFSKAISMRIDVRVTVTMRDDEIAEKRPRKRHYLIRSKKELQRFIAKRRKERRKIASDWRALGEKNAKPTDYLRFVPPDRRRQRPGRTSDGGLKLSCKGACCKTPPSTICMCTWTVVKLCFWPVSSTRAGLKYIEIDDCWDCH